MPDVVQTGFTRLFLQDGAGPGSPPVYQSLAKVGGLAWPQGTPTTIKIPDPSRYNNFLRIGKVSGTKGDPGFTVNSRYTFDASTLLALADVNCDVDLHVHMGECENPQDFQRGWRKIAVLVRARISDYGTDALGALDDSERGLINENVPFTGEDYYEILPIRVSEIGAASVVQEIVAVVVCDAPTCGACGLPSDGCQVMFAISMRAGGSPGLGANVIGTQDGGASFVRRNITTITGTEDPSGATCVGQYLVVVSQESCSLHYAAIADILAATDSWAEVATGFVAGGCPRAIFSANPAFTWIVGDNGYVYFTADPTSSVTPQDSGSATAEDLYAIHGVDELNLVAVGDNNAVVATRNGGETWETITGPAPGDNLRAVWMRSDQVWLVGTAAGELFYTLNGGSTWSIKGFPGSGTGVVRAIVFSRAPNGVVGWMAHDVGGHGRILRSIDNGYSWYVTPEGTGTIPLNDRINALAPCTKANTVYAGGLADNATDGILLKAA